MSILRRRNFTATLLLKLFTCSAVVQCSVFFSHRCTSSWLLCSVSFGFSGRTVSPHGNNWNKQMNIFDETIKTFCHFYLLTSPCLAKTSQHLQKDRKPESIVNYRVSQKNACLEEVNHLTNRRFLGGHMIH